MDKDIQEMFRKKNREILIKNLQLDIERNIDAVNDSLNNIFDYQFNVGIRNLSSMYVNCGLEKEVTKVIVPFKSKLFLALEEVIEKKKNTLLEQVSNLEFTEEEMGKYYNFVFKTTEELKYFFESDKVSEMLKHVVDFLNELGKKNLDEEESLIVSSRIYDYIHYRLFGKLVERVNSEFLIRDNNLANKGKESYEKFQELESKTSFV